MKHIKPLNENATECFTKADLFDAFGHYAFKSISSQPYNEEELQQEFDKWFNKKHNKK